MYIFQGTVWLIDTISKSIKACAIILTFALTTIRLWISLSFPVMRIAAQLLRPSLLDTIFIYIHWIYICFFVYLPIKSSIYIYIYIYIKITLYAFIGSFYILDKKHDLTEWGARYPRYRMPGKHNKQMNALVFQQQYIMCYARVTTVYKVGRLLDTKLQLSHWDSSRCCSMQLLWCICYTRVYVEFIVLLI